MKASEVVVFFRYLVPGISLLSFLILTVPWPFLIKEIDLFNGTLLGVLVTSGFIFFGWMSYHMVYPAWRYLLRVLHLYPKSRVVSELRTMLKTDDFKPDDLWSFFLWNHCKDSIRQRVKLLADYGHSLYMVSFTFIVFPLIYTSLRFAFGPNTVLIHIIIALLPGVRSNVIPLMEFLFVILSFSIGVVLLNYGYKRIRYAENIQWLIFKARKDKLQEILEKAKSEESGRIPKES